MRQHGARRDLAVRGEGPCLGFERGPLPRRSQLVQATEAVTDRGVAVEAVEEHTHPALLRRAVHAPVEIQVRRGKRLIQMPQHAVQVRQRAQLVAANEVRRHTTARDHALHVRPLVDHAERVAFEARKDEREGVERLGRHHAARDAHHRRRIEAARQRRADGRGGAQLREHRFAERLAEPADVLGVAREAMPGLRRRVPIGIALGAARRDGHGVGSGEPADAVIERAHAIHDRGREIQLDLLVVYSARHVGQREQRLDFGRKREEPRRVVVIEGLDPHGIARAEHHLAARIPHREREVADQPRDTGRAPLAVSGENQLRVGNGGRVGEPQGVAQLGAIVDAGVGDEHEARAGVQQWLGLASRFGRGVQQLVAQSNRALGPTAPPMRPAVCEGAHEARQTVLGSRIPVQPVNAYNGAHVAPGPICRSCFWGASHPHAGYWRSKSGTMFGAVGAPRTARNGLSAPDRSPRL
jgi:hypothetical protein